MGDRTAAANPDEEVQERKNEDQSVNASKQEHCNDRNTRYSSAQFAVIQGRIHGATNEEDGKTTSLLIGFDNDRPTIIMSNCPRADYTSTVTTSIGRNNAQIVSYQFTKFMKPGQETKRNKQDIQSCYSIPQMESYSKNMVPSMQETNHEIDEVRKANEIQANEIQANDCQAAVDNTSKAELPVKKLSNACNGQTKVKKSYSFIARKLSTGSKISCRGTNGGQFYGGSRFRVGQPNPTTKVCMPLPPRDVGDKFLTNIEPYLGREAPALKKVKVKMNKAQYLRAESVRLKSGRSVIRSASYVAWDASSKSTKKTAHSFAIVREFGSCPSTEVKMNRAQSIRALAVRTQSATREMERTFSLDQALSKQRTSKGNVQDAYPSTTIVENKRSISAQPKLSGTKATKASKGVQAVQTRTTSAYSGTKLSNTQPNKDQPRGSIASQRRKTLSSMPMGNNATTASQRRKTLGSMPMRTYATANQCRKSSMGTYATANQCRKSSMGTYATANQCRKSSMGNYATENQCRKSSMGNSATTSQRRKTMSSMPMENYATASQRRKTMSSMPMENYATASQRRNTILSSMGTYATANQRRKSSMGNYVTASQCRKSSMGNYATENQCRKSSMGNSATASQRRKTMSSMPMENYATASQRRKTMSSMPMENYATASQRRNTILSSMGTYATANQCRKSSMGNYVTASQCRKSSMGNYATENQCRKSSMGNYATASQCRKSSMGNYATASERRKTMSSMPMEKYANESQRRKTFGSMGTSCASTRKQSRAKSIQYAGNLNIRRPSKTPKQRGGRSQTPIEMALLEESDLEYDMISTDSSNKYSDQSCESSVLSFAHPVSDIYTFSGGSDTWETCNITESLGSDCTLMRADLHELKKAKETPTCNDGEMSSMSKVFKFLNILEPSFFKHVEPDDTHSEKSTVTKRMHKIGLFEIGSKFESVSATELTSFSQHTALFLDAEQLQPVVDYSDDFEQANASPQKSALIKSKRDMCDKSVSFAQEPKRNSRHQMSTQTSGQRPEDSDIEIELFDGPGTKHLELLRKEFGGDTVDPQIQAESSLISLPSGILEGSLANSIQPAPLPNSVPGPSLCDSTRHQKRRHTYFKSHERNDTNAQQDVDFKYPLPGQRLSCSSDTMQGLNNNTPPASDYGNSIWLPEIQEMQRAESRNNHGNSFPQSACDQGRPRPHRCTSSRSKSPCRDDSRTGVHSCNAGNMVTADQIPHNSHYICDVKNALRILSEKIKPLAGGSGQKTNGNKTTISPLTLDSAIHVDEDLFDSDQMCLDDDTQVSLVFPEQQDTSWLTEDPGPSTGPRHPANMPLIDHTDSLRHMNFDAPLPGPSSRHQPWRPP